MGKERRGRTVDCWEKVRFQMKVGLCSVQTTAFTFGEKTTKSTTHILFVLICSRSERNISLMIRGCICYDSVGTLTAVEGNINSAKYIDILDKTLWPVVVWYFERKEYFFMDDKAPVHRAHTVKDCKDQNEVTSKEWPAQ